MAEDDHERLPAPAALEYLRYARRLGCRLHGAGAGQGHADHRGTRCSTMADKLLHGHVDQAAGDGADPLEYGCGWFSRTPLSGDDQTGADPRRDIFGSSAARHPYIYSPAEDEHTDGRHSELRPPVRAVTIRAIGCSPASRYDQNCAFDNSDSTSRTVWCAAAGNGRAAAGAAGRPHARCAPTRRPRRVPRPVRRPRRYLVTDASDQLTKGATSNIRALLITSGWSARQERAGRVQQRTFATPARSGH